MYKVRVFFVLERRYAITISAHVCHGGVLEEGRHIRDACCVFRFLRVNDVRGISGKGNSESSGFISSLNLGN
jgi:hypothetical protein